MWAAIPSIRFDGIGARRAWSGVHALLDGRPASLIDVAAVGKRAQWLQAGEDAALSMALRRAENIGRTLGDAVFLARMSEQASANVYLQKRGMTAKQTELNALSP